MIPTTSTGEIRGENACVYDSHRYSSRSSAYTDSIVYICLAGSPIHRESQQRADEVWNTFRRCGFILYLNGLSIWIQKSLKFHFENDILISWFRYILNLTFFSIFDTILSVLQWADQLPGRRQNYFCVLVTLSRGRRVEKTHKAYRRRHTKHGGSRW